MANQRSMGRIDYDLWDYDVVDTAEGRHYRVIDLAGNYHGSYHNEAKAQEAAWNNNRVVAARQGRLRKTRQAEIYFIVVDPNVRGRSGVGAIVPGAVLMNQAGERIWVDNDWLNGLLVVKV